MFDRVKRSFVTEDFTAIAIIAGFLLFRILYVLNLGLAYDEAYYWVWAQFPDLSYFDHPPLVSYFIVLSTALAGNTSLGVRLPMILVSTAAAAVIYFCGRRFFSPRVGLLALIIMSVNGLSSLGGFLITPDTPLVLFWPLAMLVTYYLIERSQRRFWYVLGIVLGLGLLGKYMMILFVPAVVLFCILDPEQRHWFRKPEPYLAILIAGLLFLPVVVWNYRHDWISFAHQFNHGLEQKGAFTLKYLGEYVGGQLLLANPFFFICLVSACVWGISRRTSSHHRVSALLALVPFLFFGFSSLRARVEANWPATAYFSGAILLASWFEERLRANAPHASRWRRGIAVSAGFWFLLAVMVFLHVKLDLLQLPHDRSDELFGWDEVGAAVVAARDTMPAPGKTFLVANSYQLASQVWFNSPGQVRVYEDPTRDRPSVFSVVDSFDDLTGYSVIYITSTRDRPIDAVGRYFDSFDYLLTIDRHRFGRKIGSCALYRGYNFKGWPSVLDTTGQRHGGSND